MTVITIPKKIKEKNLDALVRRQVIGVFREFLSDPDRGLVLRKEANRRLQKSIRSKNAGKYKSLEEIFKKYSA